jgi:hypothetical protein
MSIPIERSRAWPRMLSCLNAVILAAMAWPAAAAGSVSGDGAAAPMFSFNAFGTFGVVHSSDTQADFVSSPNQPKGAGFSNAWSATPDTKLGVQLNANFTDRLSAVVQFVSQYQYDGTFLPDLEWGNIKFQITPDVNIRAGRIAIPTYMISDSLNVGYTLPFVRIPMEIYSQLPITHSDGVDGSYRLHIGDVTNTVQVFVGQFASKLPNHGMYDVDGMKGISDTVEYGAATLHFSYQTLRYDLNFPGLLLNDDPQAIASVGANYDPGKWFVSGEWIRAPDDAVGRFYAWYAVAGYRLEKFTPYVDFARAYMGKPGPLGFPPFINQNTSSIGVRWDFVKNADLKMQLDRTSLHGGIDQYFINQQPGFEADGSVTVFSLAIDFVF